MDRRMRPLITLCIAALCSPTEAYHLFRPLCIPISPLFIAARTATIQLCDGGAHHHQASNWRPRISLAAAAERALPHRRGRAARVRSCWALLLCRLRQRGHLLTADADIRRQRRLRHRHVLGGAGGCRAVRGHAVSVRLSERDARGGRDRVALGLLQRGRPHARLRAQGRFSGAARTRSRNSSGRRACRRSQPRRSEEARRISTRRAARWKKCWA